MSNSKAKILTVIALLLGAGIGLAGPNTVSGVRKRAGDGGANEAATSGDNDPARHGRYR